MTRAPMDTPMTDPQAPKGQNTPETVGSLCYHLRVMAGGPVDAIDADRLSRAADFLATAQASMAELEMNCRSYKAMTADAIHRMDAAQARAEQAEAEVKAAYIDGFEDGIHESDRRRIRPHDAQTAQESWATSQSANTLREGGKSND